MTTLLEFDPTHATTGIKKWLSRKKDAAMGAAGSGAGQGRHTIRLITNKLYQTWRAYTGGQEKQGTNVELAAYIRRFYPDVYPDLSAAVNNPRLLPPTPQPRPIAPEPAAAPAAAPTPPSQPSQPMLPGFGQQKKSIGEAVEPLDDHALFVRFLGWRRRILNSLSKPQADGQRVMTLVNAMLRTFNTKNDKSHAWITRFINEMKANSLVRNAVPQLMELRDDPFSSVRSRRPQPTSASKASPRTEPDRDPVAPPQADPKPVPKRRKPDLTIPSIPHRTQYRNDTTLTIPSIPRNAKTIESQLMRRCAAYLYEAPAQGYQARLAANAARAAQAATAASAQAAAPAQPAAPVQPAPAAPAQAAAPGATAAPANSAAAPQQTELDMPSGTRQPVDIPASLARQKKSMDIYVPKRNELDRVFQTMAQIMSDKGMASVGTPPGGAGGAAQNQAGGSGGGFDPHTIMRTPINAATVDYAFNQASRMVQIDPAQQEDIKKMIGAGQMSISQIAQNLGGRIDAGTFAMLMFAAQTGAK